MAAVSTPLFARSSFAIAMAAAFIVGASVTRPVMAGDSVGAPISDEFRVNDSTLDDQVGAEAATNAAGDSVITWRNEAEGLDGFGPGYYARTYRADGTPRSGEFRISLRPMSQPQVAVMPNGDFVAAYVARIAGKSQAILRRFRADGRPKTTDVAISAAQTGAQSLARLVAAPDGRTLVIWQASDLSGTGIFARVLNPAGVPVSDQFRVNVATSQDQTFSHVAMDADGDFIVAWRSPSGYLSRVFNADGSAVTGESRVNSTNTVNQLSLAADVDGDFVFVWRGTSPDGIYARSYAAGGTPRGSDFRVHEFAAPISGGQSSPLLAMDPDGDFAVTWSSVYQDGSGFAAVTRAFLQDGTPKGPERLVNQTFPRDQRPRAIRAVPGDGFVVVFESLDAEGKRGILGRHFDAVGVPTDNEFVVTSTGDSSFHRLLLDADGDFAVVWASTGRDGDQTSVGARLFRSNGSTASEELLVNDYSLSRQAPFGAAMDADGDLVVAWNSHFQDGSFSGVYARRLAGPEDVDLRLILRDSVDPAPLSGEMSYTLLVRNEHPLDGNPAVGLANGIRIVDPLPAGLAYTGFTGAQWNCGEEAGTVSCRYNAALAPGKQARLVLNVSTSTTPGPVTNTAFLEAGQFDSDQADNQDAEATFLGSCQGGDAGTLTFRNPDFVVQEDDGRRQVLVDRVGGACGAVSVAFATEQGTALAGTDYTGAAGTLSWAHGETLAKSFFVPIIDDTLAEQRESVRLTLSSPSGGATAGAAAALRIFDND